MAGVRWLTWGLFDFPRQATPLSCKSDNTAQTVASAATGVDIGPDCLGPTTVNVGCNCFDGTYGCLLVSNGGVANTYSVSRPAPRPA